MTKLQQRYDVVIAGGGMVGATLALSLARRVSRVANILLVEAAPLPSRIADGHLYTPSFDARSTALSYSSEQIYRELGLWEKMRLHACPIRFIHVSDRGRFGSTLLSASDSDWETLGHVVENAWLGQVLLQQVMQEDQITVASPASLDGVRPGLDVQLMLGTVDGVVSVDTELLLVADGAGSTVRSGIGVTAAQIEYGQDALITNIGLTRPHGGIAYERFTDTGPVAMLPLSPDQDGVERVSLVWTLPRQESLRLLSLDENDFLAELQARFGYRLGRFIRSGVRSSYPLCLVQAEEQVRSGIVVMGNAAHALHPVAGQGYNLAMRDIEALTTVLQQAERQGARLGDLALLQRYAAGQRDDQARTIAFSDRVTGIFTEPGLLLGLARDAGLLALDLIPGLKREFVSHTAGATGLAGARGRVTSE